MRGLLWPGLFRGIDISSGTKLLGKRGTSRHREVILDLREKLKKGEKVTPKRPNEVIREKPPRDSQQINSKSDLVRWTTFGDYPSAISAVGVLGYSWV